MIYISAELEDDIYELRNKQFKEFKKKLFLKDEISTIVKHQHPEKVIVETREFIPRIEDEEIKPLRKVTSKVIGSLFDRIDFLRQRIEETKEAIEMRKRLHKEVIKEIDEDIKEKQEIEARLADINEKRNFKLDISILRKEKRHENIQFWRDILELRTELRELLEEYKTEVKIANIFSSIYGEKK